MYLFYGYKYTLKVLEEKKKVLEEYISLEKDWMWGR